MSETNAQKELVRLSGSLEKLYNWAGTKSSPMPGSDLQVIKESIGGDLDRLVARSDMLELAPLLREVGLKDGIRTVTFDMRDGTTRSFQTMVDWFDTAPVAVQKFDQAELMEARELAESQRQLVFVATERASEAARRAEEAEARVQLVEETLAKERDGREDDKAEALKNEEALRDEFASISDVASQRVVELEQEVERLNTAYLGAAKIVDDALPSIIKGTEALSSFLKQKKTK